MTYTPGAELVPASPHQPGSAAAARLTAWAGAAAATHEFASMLVKTNICPDAFRGKAGEATAVIMYGAELGLDPIQSLRAMFVIRSQVGMYSREKLALVLSRGHRVWTEHETDDAVTVCGYRAGDPEHVERVTWTITRARQAGFVRRGANGSPSQYELQPRAMLWARAVGEICGRIAPDALSGIAQVDEPPPPSYDEEPPPPTRTVGRRGAEPVAPTAIAADGPRRGMQPAPPVPATTVAPWDDEPPPFSDGSPERVDAPTTAQDPPPVPIPLGDAPEAPDEAPDAPTDPPEDEAPPVRTITGPQRGRLIALFNGAGIRDRSARLLVVGDLVGHPVESVNDLTLAEASTVIDAMSERVRDLNP